MLPTMALSSSFLAPRIASGLRPAISRARAIASSYGDSVTWLIRPRSWASVPEMTLAV